MSEHPPNTTELPPTAVVSSTAAQPDTDSPELSGDEGHLKSIFPDLDAATIHDCYVLCDRNVERTVEFLLGDVCDLLNSLK